MADTDQNPIPVTPGNSSAKKVLIVEDEKPLADALEMKLKHEGFTVARATNGQEGLTAVLSFSPDVILLDLMMPVMDGKTMLRKLRDLPQFKTLPIIVLTNAGTVDNIRETQTFYNASEFFIKSNVSLEAIVTKIKELV
jgi:DNA-binding response OmpR family regulator